MSENKLQTITNLFEGNEIRSMWDAEKEEYYFSVIDVISTLTDSPDPSDYWTTLKSKKHKPYGLEANKVVARAGGDVAKIARRP